MHKFTHFWEAYEIRLLKNTTQNFKLNIFLTSAKNMELNIVQEKKKIQKNENTLKIRFSRLITQGGMPEFPKTAEKAITICSDMLIKR